MPLVFAVQPFRSDRRGMPKPASGGSHFAEEKSAVVEAERLWRSGRYAGVMVACQDMDAATGEYGPFEVVANWGATDQPRQPPRFRPVL